jgi:hypothetical protein
VGACPFIWQILSICPGKERQSMNFDHTTGWIGKCFLSDHTLAPSDNKSNALKMT